MKLRTSLISCLVAFGALSSSSLSAASLNQGYYRAPALHGETLLFTAEGDLWKQAIGDKQASRLTSLPALEMGASVSHDGKQVAFVANYEGNDEVYVMPLTGDVAKRVSFENSRVRLQGWTADGQVLYATDNAFGPANYWVLRIVNPETLQSQDLPLADAIEGVIDDAGEYLYFTRFGLQTTGDNAKVYRGGAKGELWRYRLGSQQEAQALTQSHEGSVRQPMLWQQRLYFVSDASGNDNIWSMDLDGKNKRQHTEFTDWQVRAAKLDQGRIVFQKGADIVMYDIAQNNSQVLDISLSSDFSERREHWVNDPMQYATSTIFNTKGDKVVVTARSHVAIAGIDGQRLVEIAAPGKSRIRQALLSHDGKWVYAISDASGEQELWRFAADGSDNAKQLTSKASSMKMSLSLSPNGRYLAFDDYDGNVSLFDIKRDKTKTIIKQGQGLGPYADISWSPDSQFIAVTKHQRGNLRSHIALYSLDDDKEVALTSDKYESYSPSFSPDGNWLYFVSNRYFKSTPSSPWGDRNMGPMFDKRGQIFAIALNEQAQFPFAAPTELDKPQADSDDEVEVNVDWNNLSQRLWQVPVDSGNYYDLSVTDKGLYVMDQRQGEASPRLQWIKYERQTPKVSTFAKDVASYALNLEQDKLFVRRHSQNGKEMLIVDAGDKLPKELAGAKVGMSHWQLAIEPQQEWQQMFDDAWLMHRDSFYDKNMRGVDWQAAKTKYQPLVDRLTDRHELNDLFSLMMGELDSLHSQVRGGDLAVDVNQAKSASIGARLTQQDNTVVIEHIYQTDAELPSQASPLAKPGVNAQAGDVIVSINGKPVTNVAQVNQLLRNQQGKQVLLGLKRGKKQHRTIVVPNSTKADAKLRYLDWVNHNADKVGQASKGEIGYLHLYAMGSGDIASFAREFYANIDKDGLIIDVRRNRGGNIDSWIIEKLLRRVWMYWNPTQGDATTNMQQTFNGHIVVLTDQLTYSDGETFSAGIKALGIAPLIGKQTAGAGVWLSGRNALTDKGMARVAEYPQYAVDGTWVVEGRGISPDIEVDNLPYATFNGVDAQLNYAIDYLQDELKRDPINPFNPKPMPARGMAADVKPIK
ncbi:S41 family peptidase [Shewanella waksmanii]|uniref:S41 family peptidase n=1 Tax=Shewanella waksmanii TaxID=213783 RepID=UPI003735AF1E